MLLLGVEGVDKYCSSLTATLGITCETDSDGTQNIGFVDEKVELEDIT